ncbi:uncharacterized protein ACR2FA_009912 [Aphomia sociella]
MVSKIAFVFCAQALLIQCAFGQVIRPSLAGITGNSIVENSVVIGNNAGASGIGLANTGLLGSSINLANSGALATGVGLANTGLLSTGLNVANTGLISGAALPAANVNYINLASVSGGGVLPINSFSPIVPAGLTVVSENAIEGPLAIVGQLPFLSAVAFEGALASEGAGAAGCGCGTSGNIGIVSESYGPIATPAFGGRLL